MWLRSKWVVLWSLWAARLVRQPTPPVQLAGSGALVRGQVAPDGSHYQYFGIPYARVAPGHLYQAAGAARRWAGVLDAVDEHVRCAQEFGAGLMLGVEDCLVLNVYVPATFPLQAPQAAAPVMVFIHGGGFKEGSGSRLLYGPDYLVAKGVVLVTFNYRLSAPGFLCLGIQEAPGNAGLKDQVAALKWVQKNIRAFGGDPDNVTIFGESAGAASVSLHLVSKSSRGLFHKALAQSGSSLAPWVMQRRPVRVASAVALTLGYVTEDPRELYRVFANHSVAEVLSAPVPPRRGGLHFLRLVFVPCVERELPGVEPFLSEEPWDILSRAEHNQVPIILGANDEEGYFFAAEETEYTLRHFNFSTALPDDLYFRSESEKNAVAEEVAKLYMGGKGVSLESIREVSRLHGHPHFQFPAAAEAAVLAHVSRTPVYSYVFAHDGWRNFAKLVSGWRWWRAPGATHADDLFYLFSLFPVPKLFENKMIDTMTTLWTNFAKHGRPMAEGSAVRWRQVTQGGGSTLLLGRHVREDTPLHAAAFSLWRRLYSTYGHPSSRHLYTL